MIVKQIDLNKALELAGKGSEVLVLVPSGPETSWTGYMPSTLQEMLEGCLFFRKEPAMENSTFEDAVEETLKQESDAPPMPGNGSSGDPGLENGTAVDSSPKRTKMIDTGKIMALHKAGWTGKKIAEEMGISEATVWGRISKMREEGKL